jgi:hypothetical protein
MNHLIIIGNGFDLAHGLNTSYADFLQWLHSVSIEQPRYPEMLKEGKCFNPDYSQIKHDIRDNSVDSVLNNYFLWYIFHVQSERNWSGIEDLYYQLLMQQDAGTILDLNLEFDHVKRYLNDYLTEEQKRFKKIEAFQYFFTNEANNNCIVLNFNYTNTVQQYISNDFKNLIHIHGELNNPLNPLIFGYAPDDSEWDKLIQKHNNDFLRNIKRSNYLRTAGNYVLNKFLKQENIALTIIGHSCGISDFYILKKIINNPKVKTIQIFPYNGYEGLFQTSMNLARISGSQDVLEKIIDLENSHEIPQHHNQTPAYKKRFAKFLKVQSANIEKFLSSTTTT